MQITEITIRPATEHLVKGYADIVFDNCFMIEGIRIIQGPTGLFISFPTKRKADGTHWDIAFPANAETRQIIQQAILEKYEKIVPESENQKANVEYKQWQGTLRFDLASRY